MDSLVVSDEDAFCDPRADFPIKLCQVTFRHFVVEAL